MYLELLTSLEASALGHAARHSAWLFTLANLLHVLGAALLVGAIAVLDIKLIAARDAAIASTARVAIPLAVIGVLLQVPTGLILLAVEARALGQNPAFYAKMAFIAVAIVNLAAFHLRFGRDLWSGHALAGTRPHGLISLGAWVSTLLAGRMIAYL
ncbi:hypothetical protein [Phreatobacter stygius]|uniref:DUF2214 domain-containing protein n=1 Tax=Phreatobacter stygius TaxID=1940610 RepID=A0A4D7BAZ3_9HYPH|nr:hypothetical protein [Phreatobacter stygius]QCI67298.1 hypothetical protein E8M01_25565 [Phreatobacter stygius]